MGDGLKVYHIPNRPTCPIRIQMSDDEVVAAIQVRDESGYAFYWLLVSTEVARKLIEEHRMEVLFRLPDTADSQVLP